jgi:hypothetical protein
MRLSLFEDLELASLVLLSGVGGRMQNVLKLEELKVQVERLWRQVQALRGQERERMRREYQIAYERFRRAREWISELGIESSAQ